MRYSNTNLNLYRTFVIAYEQRNLHKASAILGISFQGVRQNLKELARQLGGKPLFIGNRMGIEPTTESAEIYHKIKTSLQTIVEAENSIASFDKSSHAIIRIAIPNSILMLSPVTQYFHKFCNEYPNVQFEFFDRNSMDLLKQQKIDIAVRYDFMLQNTDFQTVQLFNDELVLISTTPIPNDWRQVPIITSRSIMQIIQQHDSNFIPHITTSIRDIVPLLVQNGLGIGCVLKHALPIKNDFYVTPLSIKVSFTAAYNKSSITRAAKTFLDGLSLPI